ncbi:MAG TPA: hypothetical protein VH206_18425 [Xanthobacteraceae bacterium]|jgi:hypothetical protein|nr:hypothetical protein [Xanthobacteraceae bacterium]
MAKLKTYFGPHAGDMKIYLGFFQVGSGSFSFFSDYQSQFSGTYSALGNSGTFAITLNLTDQDAASTSGPCHIMLNAQTDNAATYAVDGDKLSVTTTLNDAPLEIYQSQNGTQVDNISNHNIWIG